MLLSKWIVADKNDIRQFNSLSTGAGFCLPLKYSMEDLYLLFELFQQIAGCNAFSFLVGNNSFNSLKDNLEHAMEAIIPFFFNPSFYVVNNCPVIFIQSDLDCETELIIEELKKKSILQGFSDIICIKVNAFEDSGNLNFSLNYFVSRTDLNLVEMIDKWLDQFLKGSKSGPIHLLFLGNDFAEVLVISKSFQNQEEQITKEDYYIIANRFYCMHNEIEKFHNEISLRETNESNTMRYLDIQKKDLAVALNWYKFEYDILPLWYKQFGHIIKVIMGKRSFRSLFNDNVKKYKD